jgi:protein-S-isoprenylcysteine O-methyltransferase Ste14
VTEQDDRGPGVRFPPPLLFVTGYVVALLLQRAIPWPIAGPGTVLLCRVAGWVLLAGALVVALSALATFHRARTGIIPNRPATTLVTTGPYRFTRNPMYLSLTMVYVAGALLANTWWPLPLLPPVLVALYLLVVRREERYLAATFGERYAEYRARVRRWL